MKKEEILARITPDGVFDIYALCEVLEHLTEHPTEHPTANADKTEELYNTIMETWNSATSAPIVGVANPRNTSAKTKLLPQCRKFTPQIKKALAKLVKDKYTEEDFKVGIINYIREIISRDPANDYSKHRFSFYEFIKQENGFLKFFNR